MRNDKLNDAVPICGKRGHDWQLDSEWVTDYSRVMTFSCKVCGVLKTVTEEI